MKLDAFDFSSAVFEFALGLIRVYDNAWSKGNITADDMTAIYDFKANSAHMLSLQCKARHDTDGRDLYANIAKAARSRRTQYAKLRDQATPDPDQHT